MDSQIASDKSQIFRELRNWFLRCIMSHSYTRLVYHILFSTHQRLPLFDCELIPELRRYSAGLLKNENSSLITCGGMPDHLHYETLLHQDMSVSKAARILKANTSRWLSQNKGLKRFCWQKGYAAFTVSPSQIERVRHYIDHQAEHHRKRSFQEELDELLMACGVLPLQK